MAPKHRRLYSVAKNHFQRKGDLLRLSSAPKSTDILMNLKIDNQSDGVCNMTLSGRISQTTVGSKLDQFSQLLGEANYGQRILLSLRETDYIDSSGIGWLLATDKKIRAAGGRLVLHSLPLDVQHVFGLMKLHKVLSIAKDQQAASQQVESDS